MLLLLLLRRTSRWRLILVKTLLSRLLAVSAMLTATSFAVWTSVAVVASTSPALPSLTAPRFETSGQAMAVCPFLLLLGLLRLDEGTL